MDASKRIAVAGATGRTGRHVVELLEARGHDVVAMSRSGGVDLVTGEGLADALTGVEVVVDAATGSSPDREAATEFFTAATRNLQEAGERAGVRRMVVVSIIGADRFSGGYQAAKIAHEQAMQAGPIPARILRAAQFHEFVGQLLDWQQGDVAYIPTWPSQLVAARTVAEALVDLATDPDAPAQPAPGTPFPEIAGPREENPAEAAKLLGARRGIQVVGVDDPDDPDAEAYASGGLLPSPHAKLAGPTFQEWLDTQP